MNDDTDAGELDPLDELVVRCLDRYEAVGAKAIEEVCEQHPLCADALRRRMAKLLSTGLVDEEGQERFPDRLGEFSLIRRLGGGGMGVVYLARQDSLGREVALKLIRPDQLYFPDARQRFQREVEIVAKLQHPGIVPIYTVGEEDSVPYFAMERVPGCTLAEALLELAPSDPRDLRGEDLARGIAAALARLDIPCGGVSAPAFEGTWGEACLTIVRDVGVAMDHAHRQGVLHRDVKPSNILITADGRAMLFDFGLSVGEEVSAITRTGAQLGSLPYMAPEQLAGGGAADRRTDVYQLGATLNELLTLRRPFLGMGTTETMRAIEQGRLPAVRAREVGVPNDAVVVLEKATALAPSDRYASAASFARDLDNVLCLRPIEARPAGALLRLRRAVQRRPERAVSVLLGAALLIFGPIFFGIQQSLANKRTSSALGKVRVENARAEENLDLALNAVLFLLAEVGDQTLADVPEMSAKRLVLLERAQELFEALMAQRPDDLALKAESARILSETAEMRSDLGHYLEADEGYVAAIARLRDLMGRGGGADLRHELASALSNRAFPLRALGRADEGAACNSEALAILEELVRETEGGIERTQALVNLTSARCLEGGMLHRSGRFEEAAEAYSLALEAAAELQGFEGRTPIAVARRGAALSETGVNLVSLGRFEEADQHFVEASELLREAVESGPRSSRAHEDLVENISAHMYLVGALGDEARAEELAVEGLAEVELLIRDFPDLFRAREVRFGLLCHVAETRLRLGRPEEAHATCRLAVDAGELLIAESPGSKEVKLLLARELHKLTNLAIMGARHEEACVAGDRGVQVLTELLEDEPSDGEVAVLLGQSRLTRCIARAHRNEYPDFDTEEQMIRGLCPGDPHATMMLGVLAEVCRARVVDDPALDEARREERAAEFLERSLTYVEQALIEGYDEFAHLEQAVEFESLRARSEFQSLMDQYRD